jgi:hypothetical protein
MASEGTLMASLIRYKLGIMSGIKKRLGILATAATLASAAAAAATSKEDAAEDTAGEGAGRPRREKRKIALELSMGSSGGGGGAAAAAEADAADKKTHKVCVKERRRVKEDARAPTDGPLIALMIAC